MKKFFIVLMLLVMSISMIACGEKPDDVDDEYGDPSTWAGDSYSVRDLGTMYFDAFPDDYCYDWGFSAMYEDGKYKMWWVRPSLYDAIFYAESTDMKNWTSVERVISLSPNSNTMYRYDELKGILARPSVLHIGDTYYMYFEAPASEDPDINATVLEWDNQVFVATSSDGIEWNIHSQNNQPKPIVAMNAADKGNKTLKHYGVGQPSTFYKGKERLGLITFVNNVFSMLSGLITKIYAKLGNNNLIQQKAA